MDNGPKGFILNIVQPNCYKISKISIVTIFLVQVVFVLNPTSILLNSNFYRCVGPCYLFGILGSN